MIGPRRQLRLRDVGRDLDEELAFHFDSVVEDLMRKGRTRSGAEAEARRRFGDEARYRRELARIDRSGETRRRWSDRVDASVQAVRFAWRGIVRSPGLSTSIVLAFALGIGANATVFGIADRLLFSPPAHIVEPDAVRRVLVDRYFGFAGRRVQSGSLAYLDYTDFRGLPAFEQVGAYTGRQRMTVGRGEAARPVQAVMVTASLWDVLGARPALGRFFNEEEDRIGAVGTVVLGWNLWQSMFGGEVGAVGQTIDFGRGAFTIVGVAPRAFTGVDLQDADLWLPAHTTWALQQGPQWFEGRGGYWLAAVVRLAPGATEALAEAQATAVHRAGRQEDVARGNYDAEARVLVTPLIAARGPNAPAEAKVATWLAGVSAIVLLIACVNVANLLLARGVRQRREVGIRLALGVSRARLIGQTLSEGLILALLGAAAALLVARWGGGILRATLLPNVAWLDQGLGARTAAFSLGMAVLAGLVATLMPALAAARDDVSTTLRAMSGGITSSRQRTRALLTSAQAALSVVLLVGAGLFLRSLRTVQTLDLGFDPDPLLMVRLVEEPDAFTPEDRLLFYRDAARRLAALPGITAVSYTRGAPFYTSYADYLRAEGVDSIPSHPGGGPYVHAVAPDYLRAMRTRVVRGRGLEESDLPGAERVALINQAMARHIWPADDPLGLCLYMGRDATECTRIVGIVQNVHRGSVTEEGGQPQYYVPIDQEAARTNAERAAPEMLLVRVAADPPAHIAPVRAALLSMDARIRFANVAPLAEQLIDPQLRSWRLGATMFTLFGALALLVAALGLYSVLAFDVAQRTREIGLRSALGANTRVLLGMVVRSAARMTGMGVAAGLVVALLLAPRLQDLLYQTSPRDPVTLGTVALVLLLVSLAASCVPAWRAARVDPIVALRAD